jgi:hypothetical protein
MARFLNNSEAARRDKNTFILKNQLAIESMRKLVLTIMNNECKGLKDFFEANVPQGKLNPPKKTNFSEF